jgi:hypothetical protein
MTVEKTALTWRAFLESVAPGTRREIDELFTFGNTDYKTGYWAIPPTEIELHCSKCGGPRIFEPTSNQITVRPDRPKTDDHFVAYRCRNCQQRSKTFAVRIARPETHLGKGIVLKIGETPSFGPSLPSRLVTLFQDDIKLLSKGRRAENQGMGIGAFAYYRRIVEHQKNRLIGQIQRVAEKTGANATMLKLYEESLQEHQFTRAVEKIKDSIPDTLFINGANPLILLHDALSDGLHNRSDDECLGLAHDIRVVLAELVDRIGLALKSDTELTDAVRNLSDRRQGRASSSEEEAQ